MNCSCNGMKKTQSSDWNVIIEDYNGQKSLWDGEDQTSKITWKIADNELPKVFKPIEDILCNFTAVNYLQTCKLFHVSSDHRCKSIEPGSSLDTLFRRGKKKSVRLFLKSTGNCIRKPTFTGKSKSSSSSRQKHHFSSNKSTFSMCIKEKDGKSVLWNGKQFVKKMTLNLEDDEMFRNLEDLLTHYLAGNYVKMNCNATLQSSSPDRPKRDNILNPISTKSLCGSLFTNEGDHSATVYLQNNGNICSTSEADDTDCSSPLDTKSCSSMEIIDIKEINNMPKGSKSPTCPSGNKYRNKEIDCYNYSPVLLQTQRSDNNNNEKKNSPWAKSDWKAIRDLVMTLELDALRTMSYRNVSEEDRRKLVCELWAVNKALNKADKNVCSIRSHFRKLENIVSRNRNDDVELSRPCISKTQLRAPNIEAETSFEEKKNRYSDNFKDETCKKTKPKRVRLALDKYKRFNPLKMVEGTPIIETTDCTAAVAKTGSQPDGVYWNFENAFIGIMVLAFILMVAGAFFPNHIEEAFDVIFTNLC